MTSSVFKKFERKAYPYRYTAGLHLPGRIIGGIPSDPKVAEGWLRKKLAVDDDVLLEKMVAEVMVERGVAAEEAIEDVIKRNNLNGFKRDQRGLYIEGRQVQAMLKEAASVAANAGKIRKDGWGDTGRGKGIISWWPEHVFVDDDRIPLGVDAPTGVMQRFVQTFRGSAIQYEEYVEQPDITFTVCADYKLTDEQWAMIWLTAQQLGLGATRSQGYGRFEVTRWEPLK